MPSTSPREMRSSQFSMPITASKDDEHLPTVLYPTYMARDNRDGSVYMGSP